MNQQDELAKRIVQLLDESTDELGREQRDKLAKARRLALSRLQPKPAPVWIPAWVQAGVSGITEPSVMGVRYVIPIAALVLGLIGVVYVNTTGPSGDIADIDAGLLTDELPINAFLDQGFDSWLKRSSR
jgi:hypothetical protein